MRVNIGPYKRDLIPVNSWISNYELWRFPNAILDFPDYTLIDRAILKILEILENIVRPINMFWYKTDRRIRIKVDNYDVWSADNTLARIIHPVLIKLRDVKHGYHIVDSEDIPDWVQEEQEAWDWVLNEMIWAFEQHTLDDCGTDKFKHNIEQLDWSFVAQDNGTSRIVFNNQRDPNRPPHYIDDVGETAHRERIKNGLFLFAKYYGALWD